MKLWKIAAFLCLPVVGWGQGARYDGSITTSANNVPTGAQAPVYTLPYAVVNVCAYPANGSPCTNTASVYSDPALSHAVTQPMTADAHGRFGFWAAPGVYSYSVNSSTGSSYGTFNISLAGAGGGAATFPSTPGVVYSTSLSTARNAIYSDIIGLFSGACTGTNVIQANGSCGPSGQTYISAGSNITVTGSGTSGSPYVISAVSSTPFTINSFNCGACGTVELGAAIVNPSFTATYSTTPTSANITNTESIDSPQSLTTPFTSGTVSGTFSHTTPYTTTFTLTGIGSSTQTATQAINWQPRIFGGIGTAGASSSVTASGTTAVLSTSDVLPSIQLGAESVGQILGPYVTSGSTIYLFLTGGSHTFIDNGTGFPFPFNTPTTVTFVNANGVSITMYLYQSTNPVYGTFNLRVAS